MRRAVGVGVFAIGLCAAVAASAQLSDQSKAEFRGLGWKAVANLALPLSQSEITNLPGFVGVTGPAAVRAREIEDADRTPNIDAEALNTSTGAEAVFSYNASGYIPLNDWSDLNPNELLQQVQTNTETANSNRLAQGIPELHVTGWIEQPNLNKDTATVSWVIGASTSDGRNILNAIAIKLGRYGYERIAFIDDARNSASAEQSLLYVANAHRFDDGAAYSDYVAGTDRAAAFGVAGLVAGVLGVKLVKIAAAGGLLLLAKKAGWLVVLPFVWLWRRARSASGRAPRDRSNVKEEPKLLSVSDHQD